MEPPSKKSKKQAAQQANHQRLVFLGRDSFVSHQGMQRLLQSVKQEGIPSAFSARTQYRARKGLCSTITPYGRLVDEVNFQTGDAEPLQVGFQNPLPMLHYAANQSDAYCALIERTLEKHLATCDKPWGIVLYQDGVDPSDGLANNKSRTPTVYYRTMLEYGADAIAHEEVWFTATLIRSTSSDQLLDTLTELTRLTLLRFSIRKVTT